MMMPKIFNSPRAPHGESLAGIFDAIPALALVLFVAGLVGALAYERFRPKGTGTGSD